MKVREEVRRLVRGIHDRAFLSGAALTLLVQLLLIGVILLLLAGCGSVTRTAAVTINEAQDSGFDNGIGAMVEVIRKDGVLRPRVVFEATGMQKFNAYEGHTYSAHAGLQWRGRVFFVEPGWAWYGYRAYFRELDPWRKDGSDWYLRVGAEAENVMGAFTYYPPTDDSYDSDQLTYELRYRFAGTPVVLIAVPSVYRLTYLGKERTGTSLTLGIGARW